MKIYIINAINAITLTLIGLWGYIGSDNPSITALIPVFFGIILIVFTKWLKSGSKIIAHIMITLTLLLLIAFFKPLIGAFSRNDTTAILRVSVMMFTCTLAMIFYVRSFIEARKKGN